MLFHCISARLCVTRHGQIVRIVAVENVDLPIFEHGDLRCKLIDEIALVSVHRACTEHIESDSEAKCPIVDPNHTLTVLSCAKALCFHRYSAQKRTFQEEFMRCMGKRSLS